MVLQADGPLHHFCFWPKCEVPAEAGKVRCWGEDRTYRGHHETDPFDAVDGAEASECHRVVA
jgi:hypothetical protein